MLLTIDVGNTNIVYGLFEGTRLVHQFRVESSRGRTADEYAVIVRQLLSMRDVDPAAAYGWRSGRLSYTGAPLSEVADDLGRYFGKAVEVDPEVRALPFTGVLNLDEERAVFARLEMFLPIKAEVSPSGVRLARGASR